MGTKPYRTTGDVTAEVTSDILRTSKLDLKVGSVYTMPLPPHQLVSRSLGSLFQNPLLYIGDGVTIFMKWECFLNNWKQFVQSSALAQIFLTTHSGAWSLISLDKEYVEKLLQIKFFDPVSEKYKEMEKEKVDAFVVSYLNRLDCTLPLWDSFCSDFLYREAPTQQVMLLPIHSNLICIQLSSDEIHAWENTLLWKTHLESCSTEQMKARIHETVKPETIPTLPVSLPLSKLSEDKRIGSGSYGIVYKYNLNGTTVAVKVLVHNTSNTVAEFKKAANLSYQWQHRNITRSLYLHEPADSVMCILELAVAPLDKLLLKTYSTPLHRSGIWHLFSDLCLGMNYIHYCGVVHRDVSVGNILLFNDWTLKLCDFGTIEDLNTGGVLSTVIGTTKYQSIESQEGKFQKTSDIWSAGIILSALCGSLPRSPKELSCDDHKEILQKLTPQDFQLVKSKQDSLGHYIFPPLFLRQESLKDSSNPFHSFLATCLQIDESARGTFSDLICKLEEMRCSNNWSFDGGFSTDLSTFLGLKK